MRATRSSRGETRSFSLFRFSCLVCPSHVLSAESARVRSEWELVLSFYFFFRLTSSTCWFFFPWPACVRFGIAPTCSASFWRCRRACAHTTKESTF